MVFDFNNLITENVVNNNNIVINSTIEESYFDNTLSFITECNRELKVYQKELYVNILESGEDYEVINESFSSFFSKIKEIIDKFLKYIKSLCDRFILNLNRFIKNDKYILKHRSEFTKFDPDKHDFRFEGYNYTFSDNIPLVEAKAVFNKDFIELDFDNIMELESPEKITAAIKAQHVKLNKELKSDRYDVFRQEVICADRPIEAADFADELFMVYRNGSMEKEDIVTTTEFINKSLARFQNYKQLETSIKKTKDKIEREYNEVKKSVDNMIYRNKDKDINKLLSIEIRGDYDGANNPIYLSPEALTNVDLFIKSKIQEITQLSSIHALAFSYKLDAISESYKQDKRVLYIALNNIMKDRNITHESVVNENLFKNMKTNKELKKYKSELNYLNILKEEGISIIEYKSKYLPKMIQLNESIQRKIKSYIDSTTFKGDCKIFLPILYKEEYDEIKRDLMDFSILSESKDYIMKKMIIIDWEFNNEKDESKFINKLSTISNSILQKQEFFRAIENSYSLSIMCEKWIYDSKLIDKKIKDIENKIKSISNNI